MIDLELAEDLRRRYEAGEVPTMHDAVLEAYAEVLHPRDRRGRWAHKPHVDQFAVAAEWQPGDGLSDAQWKSMRPAEFDADVAKIENADDANAYLAKLGFPDSDLKPDGTYPAPNYLKPDWYRQVCQAVTDADRRFPVLRTGATPFVGVRIAHWGDTVLDYRDEDGAPMLANSDTWGSTGGDPRTQPPYINQDIPRVFVTITASDLIGKEWDVSDFASPATSTIYGRMMHEMGHVVAEASGFEKVGRGLSERDRLGRVVEAMTAADWGPARFQGLSLYAASAAAEGWAEIFASLNTPHGMDTLSAEDRQSLLDLQTQVNSEGVRLL